MQIEIRERQLAQELAQLATFSDAEPPAVTRVVYSPVDLQAHAYIKLLCREAGLSVREDAVGNTFARWEGIDPQLPAVATGSHIDAIPQAGAYDGTVGVLGALEAIRALQRTGVHFRRSIELVLFTSEEPTRFGIGCLGSRLLSGQVLPELRDPDRQTLDQVRLAAGFSGDLDVALADGHYSCFLELHIEQGPLLEQHGIPIGVVTHIAAPASLRIAIQGEGGHAGAVLMHQRHDAFLAAAEIALAVEAAVKATGSTDTVGTVGVCDLYPRAVNSIPSAAHMELDIRDTDAARRDRAIESLIDTCRAVASRRQLSVEIEMRNADDPAASDVSTIRHVEHVCEALGILSMRMVSRAYHDSLFMSRLGPMGMIFIPCRAGVSHRPDEYASPEDIARGVLVLAHTLGRLASE